MFDELLTKEATRKPYIMSKNASILKPVLNVFTTGTEAVVSGNEFFLPVSKNFAVYELNHILTPSINTSSFQLPSGLFLHHFLSVLSVLHVSPSPLSVTHSSENRMVS
jgi:hypothetical protein